MTFEPTEMRIPGLPMWRATTKDGRTFLIMEQFEGVYSAATKHAKSGITQMIGEDYPSREKATAACNEFAACLGCRPA
jgi:hypothetical protein